MSRPLRIQYEDACYHVMNRGRGYQRIFHQHEDYGAFLETLAEARQRFGLEIHAYCFMDNHYHLLVQTPRGNLARCMRHVNGLYTQRYNRLQNTDGPLFRGRYKAILVQADRYLLALTSYIHRNPLAAHPRWSHSCVTYPWSSYAAYLNQAPCLLWLTRDFTYELLDQRKKYQGYQRYVEGEGEDALAEFYGHPYVKPVLWDEEFLKAIMKKNTASRPRLTKVQSLLPSLAAITQAVSTKLDVSVEQVRKAARGRGRKNEARWLAVHLGREVGGNSLSEIATYYGMRHVSRINLCVRKLRKTIEINERLARAEKILTQNLTP